MTTITEAYIEKIEEALKDDAFAARVADMTSVEEVKALFAEKNIELEDEIAEAVISKLENYKTTGELEEEDLAMVSGGGAFWSTVKGCVIGGALVYTGVATAPVAIAVGGAVAIYGIVKSDTKKK